MKLLENIRVLDLTNVLSGPFATAHLALAGAEVIKVENPNGGDLARKLGSNPEFSQKLMGTSFLAQNANKKSLTLNLKTAAGKKIFRKLVKDADVVIENFRPGVMKRLTLDYDELIKINPEIIYCAISGFGQEGPDAQKPAYDQIVQGLSGVMAINGDETLNPLRAGFPLCDTVAGLNAAFAVMAALFHRERTGEGQFIDVALLDSVMPLMGWVAANWLIGGEPPTLLGNDNFTAAPSGLFGTKDGHVNIAANKQEQWHSVCDVLEVPQLKTDPRFEERDKRKNNRRQLTQILEEKLKLNNTSHWVALLNTAGVPAGPILSMQDALVADQVKFRETFSTVDDEDIGELDLFNLTAKFSKTPGKIESAPPQLSAHTNEILAGLGYSDDEVSDLKEQGVI
ncbi:MAG: CoA transferase [Gammaproteobacteria bacterium]|nr:CoA transferase [Gammaproteobacteria bacterium]